MHAIFFYLTYPFIYALVMLPMRVLYKVSDGLYYLLKWSGYRRKVVLENLRNAFPEKSDNEIDAIAEAYYRYLCDLILEVLKAMNISRGEIEERCVFHCPEWVDKIYAEGKSVVIMMGHFGNWEWAGTSFMTQTKHQLWVIYRPLSNHYFERVIYKMRTRFGVRLIPVSQTLRNMVANRNEVTAATFIADQSATPANAYWMDFLNQETAVSTGAEKLAVKFDYPVCYIKVTRPRRGHYEIFFEQFYPSPRDAKENEISHNFMKRLEADIRENPAIWLWSHRRWKHERATWTPGVVKGSPGP
jgi:KDO2-lipid IV(A) lauroyltransferase